MTLELRLSLACYVKEHDIRNMTAFVNEVLCDMRHGDGCSLARRMYEMFFVSEPFRDQLIEFITRHKAGVLDGIVKELSLQYERELFTRMVSSPAR